MENQDLLRLDMKAVKSLAESVSLAQKAKIMCNQEYFTIFEEKIKKRIEDKKEKWLNPKTSDEAANILRRKAVAYKEILDIIKADIGRGLIAKDMLVKRAQAFKSRGQSK